MLFRSGGPIVYRAGSAASAPMKPAAEFQFSRTERLRIDFPIRKTPTEQHARLLRRTGEMLESPPALTASTAGGAALLSSSVSLSFLAPGQYVFELFVKSGEDAERKLVAFSVR